MSNIQASLNKAKKEIESVAVTDNIRLMEDDTIMIVDQVRLPGSLEYKKISDLNAAFEAIRKLEVRGAPAIGIFAGYTMYMMAI